MTPPTIALPTDRELTGYLGAIKADDMQHPYETFPAPRQPSWRGGPTLDKGTEQQYRDEQADYV
ncbi:hypothetical protein ACFV0L_18770 [Streptosporangium canum]|uniref:hypothetical protein n=1 Tax=Streptosporangium canum TaxID=324952 RepID=UPI00369B80DD